MNKNELELLLSQGEGYNLEFKENFSKNIGREICAFANAAGGKIIIGISDKGQKRGFKVSNRMKSEIQDIARKSEPPIKIDIGNVDTDVFIINVFEGEDKPYSYGGKFFIREGANTQQLAREEIRTFFQKEGRVLFDEMLNKDFNIKKDFDNAKYSKYVAKAGISRVADKNIVLGNLGLLKDECIRNAGILLFAKNIKKYFINATLTCCIFQGKSKAEILDRKEYDSDIYSNYESAILYLQKNLKTRYVIKDAGPRKEVLEIPEDVLRETVLNAILHRDYFEKGACIMVEIYSDRIEISNPGGLAAGLNPGDFGKKSLSRNPLLFGLVHRMGLVEKVGSGIERMRLAMGNAGLKEPKFEFGTFFTVILKRPAWEKDFTRKTPRKRPENTQKIIDAVLEKPAITRKELAQKLGLSQDSIKHHILILKRKGILKRIGPDKGGYWEIKE
ncbi:helix-turn-helix domain-containing protein [bacterium]|nr:winged helix-turn-helix transcriptional regulator [bacterium]MBU3955797.1 helix-turn-helix domain-containing protein [bacterium]